LGYCDGECKTEGHITGPRHARLREFVIAAPRS
jgi:hypothetical protein